MLPLPMMYPKCEYHDCKLNATREIKGKHTDIFLCENHYQIVLDDFMSQPVPEVKYTLWGRFKNWINNELSKL